jgi:hypothetical protein
MRADVCPDFDHDTACGADLRKQFHFESAELAILFD